MTEIYKEEQLAGITNIEFFLINEITNWPKQLTDKNSHLLVFNKMPTSIVATVDEESFGDESKLKESASGTIYDISLKFSILTRSDVLELLLDLYFNKPGIALVRYYNGFSKIFGTNEEPLFLKFTNKNGSTITDKAYINVDIEGQSRNRPVYYTPSN